jgi:hypothetical protein
VVNRGVLKPPDEVRPFLKILVKKPGFKQNPDKPAFVPVLLFSENPEEDKAVLTEFAAVKMLPKTLDLREIDLVLQGLTGSVSAM